MLCAAIKTGILNTDHLKPYNQIKDEILIDYANTILLSGMHILLSESLCERAFNNSHVRHQGQSKTTALLHEYVWFINMGHSVKYTIEQCPCWSIIGTTKVYKTNDNYSYARSSMGCTHDC